MKIEHIMSNNLIVSDINSSIQEIAKKMKENDIGIIPIVKENRIIGVLTDRDIVVRIIANNDQKIESYISQNIITIDKDDKIENAIDLMGKNKIKRLLVSNNNKIVGIISISDLINKIDNTLLINNLKKIYEIYRNTDTYITKIDEFKL